VARRLVLVAGYSFAGPVITGVADRAPARIGHLVYLDALIVRNGESAFSAFPPDVVAARRKLAEPSGGVSVAAPDPSAFGVTYIAMKPDYPSNAGSRAFAKAQPGWRYVELAGGHDAMVTTAQGLTDILLGV
jgi:pimeloyl-ACP methyl ester carboxylesterase